MLLDTGGYSHDVTLVKVEREGQGAELTFNAYAKGYDGMEFGGYDLTHELCRLLVPSGPIPRQVLVSVEDWKVQFLGRAADDQLFEKPSFSIDIGMETHQVDPQAVKRILDKFIESLMEPVDYLAKNQGPSFKLTQIVFTGQTNRCPLVSMGVMKHALKSHFYDGIDNVDAVDRDNTFVIEGAIFHAAKANKMEALTYDGKPVNLDRVAQLDISPFSFELIYMDDEGNAYDQILPRFAKVGVPSTPVTMDARDPRDNGIILRLRVGMVKKGATEREYVHSQVEIAQLANPAFAHGPYDIFGKYLGDDMISITFHSSGGHRVVKEFCFNAFSTPRGRKGYIHMMKDLIRRMHFVGHNSVKKGDTAELWRNAYEIIAKENEDEIDGLIQYLLEDFLSERLYVVLTRQPNWDPPFLREGQQRGGSKRKAPSSRAGRATQSVRRSSRET